MDKAKPSKTSYLVWSIVGIISLVWGLGGFFSESPSLWHIFLIAFGSGSFAQPSRMAKKLDKKRAKDEEAELKRLQLEELRAKYKA